jgi:Abnormal spindle-like microcephaly-assoc'd, ASPM-SPD-2-Hydin
MTQHLQITVAGVTEWPLDARDSAYRYRYEGLRLLVHSDGKYFMVPVRVEGREGDHSRAGRHPAAALRVRSRDVSRGALLLCVVALIGGVAVGACAGGNGSGSGGGGGGQGASATGGSASNGDEPAGESTTPTHQGPDGPVFIVHEPNFSPTHPGDEVKATLVVENPSDEPQTIDGIQIAGADKGDFVITENGYAIGTELQPGAKCTVQVTFSPEAEGERKAALQVTDESGDVAKGELQGSGIAPEGETGTDG